MARFEINLIEDNDKLSIQITDRETRYSTIIEEPELHDDQIQELNAFAIGRILINTIKPKFIEIAKSIEITKRMGEEKNKHVSEPISNILNNFSKVESK